MKNKLFVSVSVSVLSLFMLINGAFAASVVPGSGGQNLPAGSGFVTLSNILLNESAVGDIKLGGHTFSIPSGWEFDTSSPITVETNSMALSFVSSSIFATANSFTFTVNSQSWGGPADVIISNVRIRPLSTSSGNITQITGVITGVVNDSTSFGYLSVAGSGSSGDGGSSSSSNFSRNFAVGSSAPSLPPYEISFKINNGAGSTNDRKVVLNIKAQNAGDMIFSNEPNFDYSILMPFSETKEWTLSEGNGKKTVYAKFRSPVGMYSDVISASINLEGEIVSKESKTEKESSTAIKSVIYPFGDINNDGAVNIADIISVIANFGSGKSGNKADLNGNGVVDIKDFNSVIANFSNTGKIGNGIVVSSNDADFVFDVNNKSVKAGETFTLKAKIKPAENTIYTARVVVDYPVDVLELKTASTSTGLIPLLMGRENDGIDNVSGVAIKTVALQGGFSGTPEIVSYTFYVKKAGSAVVKINSGSVAMDRNGANKFSGKIAEVTVSVTSSTPVVSAVGLKNTVGAGISGKSNGTAAAVSGGEENKVANKKGSVLVAGVRDFATSVPGYIMILVVVSLITYFITLKFRVGALGKNKNIPAPVSVVFGEEKEID